MKTSKWICAFWNLSMTVVCVISAKIDGGWDTSPNTQYHIQTDEGPERYFRYQTISGQYRKERRLPDGTVIGSYGWVDADGYLHLNDYIADSAGYRILKNKKVYVGPQAPIQGALNAAKSVPPIAGTQVSAYRGTINEIPAVPAIPARLESSFNNRAFLRTSTTSSPYIVSHVPDEQYRNQFTGISSSNGISYPTGSFDGVTSKTSAVSYPPDSSKILIFPHSSTTSPAYYKKRPTPPAGYYPTTTASPLIGDQGNEVSITPSPQPNYYRHNAVSVPTYSRTRPIAGPSPGRSPYQASSGTRYNVPFQRHRQETSEDYQHLDGFGAKVPYSDRRTSSVNAPEGDRQQYDGVSVTNNGFKYYLPRHYHEEESNGDQKAGSFGYIDPFGIRRVIYYNASPNSGFVHRKNNRYVGFDATPYDPRP